MILETIVTTRAADGQAHIAPMGVHVAGTDYLIMPFRPSTTLDNVLETHCAAINFTDDVRIFAGCLTGRRDWPLAPSDQIDCPRLQDTLAHIEVELTRLEDDVVRPKLFCHPVHSVSHRPFRGFNRAQFSVLEGAILVSRLRMLPAEKIQRELDYLHIGIDKTAGPRELEAWNWILAAVANHGRRENSSSVSV